MALFSEVVGPSVAVARHFYIGIMLHGSTPWPPEVFSADTLHVLLMSKALLMFPKVNSASRLSLI